LKLKKLKGLTYWVLLFGTREFEQEKWECLHVMLLVVGENVTPLLKEIMGELVLKLLP
jgi:hypothetical protein